MRIECKVHHLSLTSLIVPSAKVLSQVLPAQLSPSVFYDLKESWNKFRRPTCSTVVGNIMNETETEYAMLKAMMSLARHTFTRKNPSTGDVVVLNILLMPDMKEYPYMEMRSRSIQIYGDYTPKFMTVFFTRWPCSRPCYC